MFKKGKSKGKKDMKAMKLRAKGRKFNKFAGKAAKNIKSGPRVGGLMNAGMGLGK